MTQFVRFFLCFLVLSLGLTTLAVANEGIATQAQREAEKVATEAAEAVEAEEPEAQWGTVVVKLPTDSPLSMLTQAQLEVLLEALFNEFSAKNEAETQISGNTCVFVERHEFFNKTHYVTPDEVTAASDATTFLVVNFNLGLMQGYEVLHDLENLSADLTDKLSSSDWYYATLHIRENTEFLRDLFAKLRAQGQYAPDVVFTAKGLQKAGPLVANLLAEWGLARLDSVIFIFSISMKMGMEVRQGQLDTSPKSV